MTWLFCCRKISLILICGEDLRYSFQKKREDIVPYNDMTTKYSRMAIYQLMVDIYKFPK